VARSARNQRPKNPAPVWLCVFEVADTEQQRRHPDKPNVRVTTTECEPGPKLDEWVKNSPAARKKGYVRVLYSEMPGPDQQGGLRRPFRKPADDEKLDAALKNLREQLRCRKYTVNCDARLWRLYVIELDITKLRKKPAGIVGFVYVGQSHMTPEERAEKHRLGPNYPWKHKPAYSKPCHKYFKKHRQDMVPPQFCKPYFCESAALLAESKMRLYFIAKKFKVLGGKDRQDRMAAKAKGKRPTES